MKLPMQRIGVVLMLMLFCAVVRADEFDDTIKVFQNAGESGQFFKKAYGYAVFPTIGKGGVGIGGAHGKGRVYQGGKYVGDTSMTQVTAGFQLGAQASARSSFSKTSARSMISRVGTSSLARRLPRWRLPLELRPAPAALGPLRVPAPERRTRPLSVSTAREWRSSRWRRAV